MARGPLRAFLADDTPTLANATSALRLVYLGIFAAQLALAGATAGLLGALVGRRPPPSDSFAVVLLLAAAAHVPLAWVLARAAARAGGKGAALSSAVLAGVLSSVPAWFALLMLLSGQRPSYLLLVGALLCVAYGVGFVATGRAAVAATRPTPGPGEGDA
jgi:hypothetical protein